MRLTEALSEAAEAIRHNRLRTFLSLLGMVIGTASVVAVISAGAMMKREFIDQADSIGARLIVVYQNWEISDWQTANANMDGDDVEAMRAFRPNADFARVLPMDRIVARGSASKSVGVRGTDPVYWEMWPKALASGRLLDEGDESRASKVAVLTEDLASAYFPKQDAIGSALHIGEFDYTVVGIIATPSKPSIMSDGSDRETIFLPYSSMERVFDWRWYGSPKVFELMMRSAGVGEVDADAAAIEAYLRRTYGEVDGKCRFKVEAIGSALKIVRNIFAAVSLVIAFLAGISLLVSGIGIMNVMLVAVSERTREIGVRKALGARPDDILAQFLAESLFICLSGGIAGIGLGVCFAMILSAALRWGFLVPWTAPFAAFGVSAAIGVFFGLQPAVGASRLEPVAALAKE